MSTRTATDADALEFGLKPDEFARAVELSRGQHAGPFVSLAESVATAERDRRAFESLLEQALRVDVDARPEWRLANLVMQRRARRLLRQADEFFPE